MSSLVVIEGLDGAGKSLQIELLKQYFNSRSLINKHIHFPRLASPIYGSMIASFLRGEYGNVSTVNPYLVTLLYAGDRLDAKESINSWLSENDIVLLDRYVYSNIAFQCAKLEDQAEKAKLEQWIIELEYEYNKIPRPNLSLFLHVPFNFVTTKLSSNRVGSDRDYLNGKIDIHESSLDLQKRVEEEYIRLAKSNPDFELVKCFNSEGNILPPEDINQLILEVLKEKGII